VHLLAESLSVSGGKPSFPRMGVSTGPGEIALTRMPRSANSVDAILASVSSAALLPEYAEVPAIPMCTPMVV